MKSNAINLIFILILLISMETISAQNPGEIIFSSSLTDPANPASVTNQFSAGDHIYAIAYLPDALKNLYRNQSPNGPLQVEIFIYEVKMPLYEYQQPMDMQLTFANMWVNDSGKDKNHLLVDVVPEPTKTTSYGGKEIVYKSFGKKFEGPVAFAEALSTLSPGEHTIKVAVHCYYAPVATGVFTINGNDYSRYSSQAVQINEAAVNAASAGAEFPKAMVSDAGREAKMIQALKNSNDWKSGFIDGTEVLKTAITYDWEIRRHEISGAILHRYCICAMAVRTKSGGCAYYKVTFQEDYADGKFLPLNYDGVGDKVTLQCDKL